MNGLYIGPRCMGPKYDTVSRLVPLMVQFSGLSNDSCAPEQQA